MSLKTAYVASALLSRRAGVLHAGPRCAPNCSLVFLYSSDSLRFRLGASTLRIREIHHAFNVGFRQQSGRNLALQIHALRSSAPTRHFSLWRGKTSSPPSDPAISPTPQETIDESAEVVSPATEEPVTTVSAYELPASEPLLNDTVVDTALSSVPAAMQYGDLAALGLISWTPAGLVRWALEGLQVSTGLPWFHTIVLVSVLARILVLPFNIVAMRENAKLAPYRAQLTTVVAKMRGGRDAKDLSAMMRARDAQRVIFETAGVSPTKLALASIGNLFIQVPLSLGLFFGIKKVCEFPVEQLKYSGISWIPDLTVPDPTFILPLATVAFISLQSKVCFPKVNRSSSPSN